MKVDWPTCATIKSPAWKLRWSSVGDSFDIIGWRYADEAKPDAVDPYAELKAAHAAGKVIQWKFKDAEGWMDKLANFDEYPENCDFRIKPDEVQPDEVPWIEWHGGPCPLRDEEVEEWEIKFRTGYTTGKMRSTPARYMGWLHTNIGGDIIAYRVLKTKKPAPKQNLGPSDIPPGSVLRSPSWEYGGHVTPSVFLGVVCWANTSGNVYLSYEQLMKNGWLINRSLATGKWNPEAWEPCHK
jgi:hypothetical protein